MVALDATIHAFLNAARHMLKPATPPAGGRHTIST
jgi:hypothetical protein